MHAHDLLIGMTAAALFLQLLSLLYLAIVVWTFIGTVSKTTAEYRARITKISTLMKSTGRRIICSAELVREITHDIVVQFHPDTKRAS